MPLSEATTSVNIYSLSDALSGPQTIAALIAASALILAGLYLIMSERDTAPQS